MNRILRGAPAVEEIFHMEKDGAFNLVLIKRNSTSIGMSVADIKAEGEIEILGIDRAGTYLTKPDREEKIAEGDRLLVYGNKKSVKQFMD